MKEKISVVVPCFNERESIPCFYPEMDRITHQMNDFDFEIIFVDDGSKDGTLQVLRDLSEKIQESAIFLFPETLEKKRRSMPDWNILMGIMSC